MLLSLLRGDTGRRLRNGLSGGGGNCEEGATTGITVSSIREAASNKMGGVRPREIFWGFSAL